MRRWLLNLYWKMKGLKVYGLVGKSGTGKSFRARLVAEKYNVEMMIDDGLLIRDQKIIAGKSAKRETAYLAAVKTALFADKDHRKEVRRRLDKERFSRVLILGTSDKMVERIAKTLRLPAPFKIVHIEDIATAEEIKTAMHYRQTQGKHVIPVPALEVKRNYPRIMADSVKVFLGMGIGIFRKNKMYEKTIVQPVYSRKGTVSISEPALSQMILHCVHEYSEGVTVGKVIVKHDTKGYRLVVHLAVPFGLQLSGTIHNLQDYIMSNIEQFTGITIDELDIIIDTVAFGADET